MNINTRSKELPQYKLPYKVIIFDCDGVLLGSEGISSRVEVNTLNRLGFPITFEEYNQRFPGVTTENAFYTLAKEKGVLITPNIIKSVEDAVLEALEQEVKPIKQIFDVLEQISLPKAVVSNSHLERLKRLLTSRKLIENFSGHVYSADMVKRPKPAPDIYLLAAAKLGFLPAECLVIEDSPTGIEAAFKAGMTVFGFMGTEESRMLGDKRLFDAGAEIVFTDMPQLIDLLRLPHHCLC